MITSVDEFLARGYAREQIERKPLADAEMTDMVRLLAKKDLSARLATLQNIPEQRCQISATYRGLLTRALALA